MIMDKYVTMKWTPTNKTYYMDKGYSFTKIGEEFHLKVEDLHEGSKIKVNAQCSGCGDIQPKQYTIVHDSLYNTYRKAYYCKKCIKERIEAEINAKQKVGALKRGENGYWTFKENIEKEIFIYLDKHGNFDGLARKDKALDYAIRVLHDKELYEILGDYGLDFRKYFSVMPESYINNIDNVKNDIWKFINEHKRYPTIGEMTNELRIDARIVRRFGGANELRKKVGYFENDKLIDSSGYKNRSIFELKVSEYLLSNGVYAKRDDYIFKDTNHTCDFIVEDKNGNKYYIECWGYNETSTNKIAREYVKHRKLKEALYSKNNYKLISIEHDDVMTLNNDDLQEFLKGKFNVFADKELKVFKNVEYLDTNELTNDELLKIVMKYSDNDNCLPYAKEIIEKEHYTIYNLILGRFGSYDKFAKYFGKDMIFNKNKNKVS